MTDDPAASALAAWLERIEAMHPTEIELGLERIRQVASRLGVSTMPVPVITVAGTNGKGSTLRLMQVLAERHGRRVCLYTSPHLHRFNERVRLPDGLASDQQLCEAFEQVEQARQDISLTYFEFSTLAALWLFRQSGADLVLLEVGLGGRLDAVNIVDPDVAVVTSVGLDHQDWLGETREAIAGEKCGIARSGKPLVFGEADWPQNLPELAGQYAAVPVFAGRDFRLARQGVTLCDGRDLAFPDRVVLGRDNLATACQALSLAGVQVDTADCQAVAEVTLFGRCEFRQIQGRACWFDVGHNLPAVARFLQMLPPCEGARHLVFGMMADKPIDDVVALFTGQPVSWHLAAPAIARAAPATRLAAALPEQASCRQYASVREALQGALNAAQADDQVLIFGSFYTVAEARGEQGG
ncbi:folylpolyglutamate synthase/dihydrofolate synthase family protein [uncultured Alcanivorax sp.]|jgi:dihydrofolate synthase/folylpolyglutamate synthase|uniref:bifunctional folylpolyglutamate synthase/dihydrofolate synthase n=1 Tax=Alcanivorax sp. TaxID=1872427 RepID=UPI0026271C52|nr:folylpolyglutamate synthase/dihydrofolate synthase family protein [uncultured Alcanivorax sp.]